MNNKNEVIKELFFFRQKIMNFTQKEGGYEYELLLRQKKDGRVIFPENLFYEIIVDRNYHKLYIEHLSDILYNHVEKTLSLEEISSLIFSVVNAISSLKKRNSN